MHEATIFLADPGETTPAEASLLAEQILTDDERQRAARFVTQQDRHDQLVSRALVRLGLSACFTVPPHAWRFERDAKQRPFVTAPAGLPRFQFSLSHTAGLIALLVTSAERAGLDVEHTARTNDLALVATRVCSPTELESLNRLASDAWRERFFQLWTLKEAYAKARGLGIGLPLNRIAFSLRADDAVAVQFSSEIGDDPAAWQFHLRRVTSQHLLAAAIDRDGARELKLQRLRVGADALEPAR